VLVSNGLTNYPTAAMMGDRLDSNQNLCIPNSCQARAEQ